MSTTYDPELKSKWIEALRSNLYNQAIGWLHDHTPESLDSYCCLGVLCEITPPTILPEWDGDKLKIHDDEGNYTHEEELPHAIRFRLGLSEIDCQQLMRMNDEGQPFPIIADWIESNVR